MGHRNTRDMDDYLDDFEAAAKDYAELGPLWAELVFPDDFEALKALYGKNSDDEDNHQQDDQNSRSGKR